jgi:metal-responsive CopG/Arc/MetJ family transcriptional regulator
MAAKRVQVSLDEALLKRIDQETEARRAGRSAFVRRAVELYLESNRRGRVDEQIRTALSGSKQEIPPEVDELMRAQAWPRS